MMNYHAEGVRRHSAHYTREALRRAQMAGALLESRALSLDGEKALHFDLDGIPALMPHDECADGVREGNVRDIALITRVGRSCCFLVQQVPEDGPVLVSRAAAQKRCKAEYLDALSPGDLLPCRVTHIEPFGAFCDVGCGISALLPIDSLSVSRIASPADRVSVGQDIRCVLRCRDAQGRLVLSMKELLGTWEENAALFSAGETVVGIVRSVETYGVFVELAPNLAGLAECTPGVQRGQLVSVYIKSILPQRSKIKLVILHAIEDASFRFPLRSFVSESHIDRWVYSQSPGGRVIETVFTQPAAPAG